ncbi:MAG: galactokinase [Planctomycetes bacterium]|nr:galactokinase [Planctomycetota bacterium]MBU4400166.1 galactokinase [Planctomycetota bacterium]MCG2682636.1 hypothetical protein [Planctomycetales bacterium]
MTELSFPGALDETDELARMLAATGLSREACRSKARLFARAASALSITGQTTGGQPSLAYFVPGRIEVLGKHTDYAGGRTMVAAAERGFCFAATPRDDNEIVVIDAQTGETIVFLADPELKPQAGSWANYPMTVARRVARNFPAAVRGVDIALAGDLPPAAGMSSSSALMVGVFLVLAEVNQLSARDDYWRHVGENKIDLAGYLGAVENGRTFGELEGDLGVGTFGGSEDHTAILCAEPGRIGQYGYCPVEFEKSIPVPPGYLFAVGVSGVKAEKTGAALEKYNAVSRRASTLLELWRRETGRDDPHLAAALGSSPDAAERLKQLAASSSEKEFDSRALVARLEHFMLESGEIIPEAGDAFSAGDLRAFGRLVDRSQHAAEQLLGNQVPETVFLAASARRHGAAAASAFGAGFGGSVWALVEADGADDFLAAWSDEYRQEFPQHVELARFFTTPAGPAAFRVEPK